MKTKIFLIIIILNLILLVIFSGCEKSEEKNLMNDNKNPYFNEIEFGEYYGELIVYNLINNELELSKKPQLKEKKLIKLQENYQKQKILWERFKKIIPKEIYINNIKKVIFFTEKISSSHAYVYKIEKNLDYWAFAININNKINSELDLTYIHEAGHLITLDVIQVNPRIKQKECENYYLGEGCSSNLSYINKYYQEFWNLELFEESYHLNQNFSYEKWVLFYNKYKDSFINLKSSLNVEEDIAEHFVYFIILEKPIANSTINKKILFFYDFPKLVEYREEIRKNYFLNE